jgi:signal transduction histidine kinase
LAPLSGPPLVYPSGAEVPSGAFNEIAGRAQGEKSMAVSLEPGRHFGMAWAIPLWSERGPIGVLLLGEKRDGSLYAQEEIEVARAAGERLLDYQASAEMARRLMDLQRQRLAESQVLDRRARRTLHDEVLPRLHTALLALNSLPESTPGREAIASLASVHRQIADLLRSMPAVISPELAHAGLLNALRQVVEGELADAFDEVVWQIEPEGERCARGLQPLAAETVFYAAREAIRNAAHHGRHVEAKQPFQLQVCASYQAEFVLSIEDNGVGLAHSGAQGSPREKLGGQGLALHSTMMAVIGGSLETESLPGRYTRIRLVLPRPICTPASSMPSSS